MAFIQASAPIGLRTDKLLSADNSIPERHIVINTLRTAAPLLGLSAAVISTLDAMLSCLAPKRNHHTVFASNATLMFRRNGVSDRTIRRHAAILSDTGLLERRDSPNRKRFTKHNSHAGTALRFGFDLSPLFARLHEIAAMAAEVLKEKEQIDYIRSKIRAAANQKLERVPGDEFAISTLRMLRRKLSLTDCEHLLSQQTQMLSNPESETDKVTCTPSNMSTKDGQIVRHHHKSNKEIIDKEETTTQNREKISNSEPPLSIQELLTACPEAAQFSLRAIESISDAVAHARTLAPMIGISSQSFEAAQTKLGPLRAAATVWAIMQFHDKIKSVGAYFRSITTGAKSDEYSPEKLVRRLALVQKHGT